MKKHLIFTKILQIIMVISFSMLIMSGCKSKVPSPDLIEKAKQRTQSILDSLSRNEYMIIKNVNLDSEFYDETKLKYVINYEIESGLDSTNIIEMEASVFIEKEDDKWKYSFVFDETYEAQLK